MTAQHARLAPSSAGQWGPDGCPGSVAMQERYPEDQDGEAARLGTAAHHYMAETLTGQDCPVGSLAPNGVPIDSEMVDCAQALIVDVRDTVKAASAGSVLQIEQRVFGEETIHPDNWGTPDVYLLDRPRKTLHVWDYKYGHKYVSPVGNWQCVDYAGCIFESEGVSDYRDWTVTITIAQPRNYAPEGPIREWMVTGATLTALVSNLAAAARAASPPDAELRTGPHCYGCSAQVHCPANQRARGNAVDVAYRQIPAKMDYASMALERLQNLAALQRLKDRDAALEETMLGALRTGTRLPGWTMQPTQGRKRWKLPADEVIAMAKLVYDVDLSKPAEAITPTQATKMGVDRAVIDDYAETPTGAMKLVQVDDAELGRAFGAPPHAQN